MGKPRLIILIRHAQSVGNANRTIHQTVPDHRVPLTSHGRSQAVAAGDKLASLLLPTDTLQIITSPYTRTRETTQGILSSSLQHHPNASTIRVYEEPRIREQDFGNFQPCQTEMTRMWHERAAYGHFFYRIPNGESAADAYDRVSGFNESLWRQFAEEDFPSVLVLVTHGLMTRIFLMKWYHYSVEYFEDLRNVEHCEFIMMKKHEESGKYDLQTELRTWSGYKREQEELRIFKTPPWGERQYGGCVNGCNHEFDGIPMGPRHEVMQAGRDFGGSRSGATSRA
ncbi:phosphoglycerate mutase-like protein, partial [Wilcoxina mikolae CBS 423.85]